MNSPTVTLDPISIPTTAKTILSKDGFTCSLITLAPGDETSAHAAEQIQEHLLFAVEGEATIRFEEVNTILSKYAALLIPRGKPHVIAAEPNEGAKLLRIDVPPRQVVVPQIISFDR